MLMVELISIRILPLFIFHFEHVHNALLRKNQIPNLFSLFVTNLQFHTSFAYIENGAETQIKLLKHARSFQYVQFCIY